MAAIQTLTTDDDLDAAWTRVVHEFEKEAQSKPGGGRKLTIEEVLATIRPKDGVQSTKEKAKSVVHTILVCVQRFGDIVVTATSAIFAPSQQCFNALNFVIKKTQDYGKLFEDLTTLLERVSVFLETLRTYLDQDGVSTKLDKRLRPNIYRVREHFIVILTLTVRLTSRRSKIKAFTKLLLFSDDSGVSEALATLETRVSDVVRIQVAVIGQDLSETARNIRELKGDIDLMLAYDKKNADILGRIEARNVTKQSDETIRSFLSLDTFDLGMDRLATLNEQRIAETGSWLFSNNDTFTQWCDLAQPGSSTLFLAGKPQSGRSFLTCAVVEYLREKILTLNGDTGALLAYHFANLTSTTNDQSISLMNRVLRSAIWQIATSDTDFYRFVLDICERKPLLRTWEQVWRTFFIGYNPPRNIVLFVVFDGVESMTSQDVSAVGFFMSRIVQSTLNSRLHLRLFMTAPPLANSVLSSCSGLNHISLSTGLGQAKQVINISDVQQVIQTRLRNIPMFRQYQSLSNRQHYQRILDALSRNVQNDFNRLDLIFQELHHCLSIRQLDNILNQINEPIELKIRRQVEILNQTLTQDEIQEVKAIMVCIESFAVEDVNVDVQLVEQFVDCTLQATRLVPLGTSIEGRYHSPFEIKAPDLVCWRFDGLKTYLLEEFEDERTLSRISAKRGSRDAGLDPEELDLLERIVQTNFTNVFGTHGNVLFEKYGFEDFFRSKRGVHKATISFGDRSSRISALSVALKVLCVPDKSFQFGRVHYVAAKYLRQLLDNADRSVATIDEAQSISRWIVTLLRNDAIIDRWSANPRWSDSLLSCFGSMGHCEAFGVWLKGLEPSSALYDWSEKDWLRECNGDFWSYAIDRILLNWAKRKKVCDSVVSGFLHTDGSFVTLLKRIIEKLPTIDQTAAIRRCVEAQASTNFSELKRNEHKAAIDACTRILNDQPETWWALFFRAKMEIQCFRQDHQASIQNAQNDLSTVISLDLIEDDLYAKYYWSEMIPLLALSQAYLHNFTGVRMTFMRIMENDFENNLRLYDRLG
ncbi:hypothetical protein E8E12_007068 [Didymella heteroderae]|uniref:Fungal STAND N-terminal Goodbye domain-containing protein n=1 Tax=Didymella heteroderae TaxID=1769908 RepID=A0A9P4WTC9_9PLEO|nr:hypothetical protein E8E12_007068 [Didymella heteroderae]